ncbi:ABC transporter ATP-binding protein [Candidatus Bathyarchaeota archaeon]|nr:ABC transporter ATP-binding protein [Candidatus Bathyarchaeota archaeon]
MLEVNNIDVYYGLLHVLWDVSLRVEEGETVVLIGPNGHGKTTILKTIAGLLKPRKGCIRLNGQDLTLLPPHKTVEIGITYIPQDIQLFPDMTVMENLALGAYPASAWKRRYERLKTVFEIFPRLKERRNQLVRSLSGGERRMLAIGRGLMSNGKVLLIDEPSCGLAPKLVKEVFEKIKDLKEKMKLSILMAEQNIRYLPEIADRIYLIENGRVILEGSPHAVLESDRVKEAYIGI